MKSRYGHERVLRGPDDPDVAEDRPLRDVGIVRAQRQPDEHVVAQADVRDLGGGERLSVLRRGEDIGAALAFELEDVGALHGQLGLRGDGALRAAELERREAVAVHHAIDVGGVGVLAGPHHQAGLAMRIDALSKELHACLQDEVAGHALPDEAELVALGPHVRAAGGERELLRDRVVGGRSRDLRRADVSVAVERTEARPLAGHRGCRHHHGENARRPHQSHTSPQPASNHHRPPVPAGIVSGRPGAGFKTEGGVRL